jgi:hypothetical protein
MATRVPSHTLPTDMKTKVDILTNSPIFLLTFHDLPSFDLE